MTTEGATCLITDKVRWEGTDEARKYTRNVYLIMDNPNKGGGYNPN